MRQQPLAVCIGVFLVTFFFGRCCLFLVDFKTCLLFSVDVVRKHVFFNTIVHRFGRLVLQILIYNTSSATSNKPQVVQN